ncbi:MAG: hypothetical protein ACRYGR_10600 [Janthinobacterium lividum]
MILSVIQAAKRVGVSRSKLYSMREKGILSFTKSENGKLGVEASELTRVFPKDICNFVKKASKTKTTTEQNVLAETVISGLRNDIEYLKEKINFFENQLVQSHKEKEILLAVTQEQTKQLLGTRQAQKTSSWRRLFSKDVS